MRKAFKHTGVLMMTALIGLSIIGAAYALWYENLKLTATVQTGTFDVDWSTHPDRAPVQPIVGLLPEGTEIPKWLVGTEIPAGKAPECKEAVRSTAGQAPDHTNDVVSNNILTLAASKVYPYAGCEWTINIHNVGTVPAHIQVVAVNQECAATTNVCSNGDPLVVSIGDGWYAGDFPAACRLDPNPGPPACPSSGPALAHCEALFEATQGGPTVQGLQLHTSNELFCKIRITLKQDALAEGDLYIYTIELKAHQWNEDQN